MLINKLLRFLIVIFFCLLPFVLTAFLPDGYLLFFAINFCVLFLTISICLCFPQLGKSKPKPPENEVNAVRIFKLFSVFLFFVSIVIILKPFMPLIFQERFAFVIITVILEVGTLAMIVGGGFNVEVTEEQRKKIIAEAKEYFEKYHNNNKQS